MAAKQTKMSKSDTNNNQQVLLNFASQCEVKNHLAKPPRLKYVFSLSCNLRAREFFRLVKTNQIDAVLDTRVSREYRGPYFSSNEDDFRYLCECNNVTYKVIESLSPTKEMRTVFANRFKDVKSAADRDPMAWTVFLQLYQANLIERKVISNSPLNEILYGDFESLAIVCACKHHDDCHRSYACGLLSTVLPGVKTRILYPGDEPSRSSPRRYRLADFPWANLTANGPKRKMK